MRAKEIVRRFVYAVRLRWCGFKEETTQATLVVDGDKLVLHLLPSGILRDNCVCIIGQGVIVDPGVLWQGIHALRERHSG